MKRKLALAGLLAASLLPVAGMARDRDDDHGRHEQLEHRRAEERQRINRTRDYGYQTYNYRNQPYGYSGSQPYYGPYGYYGNQPYGYSQPYYGGGHRVENHRDRDHDRDDR